MILQKINKKGLMVKKQIKLSYLFMSKMTEMNLSRLSILQKLNA